MHLRGDMVEHSAHGTYLARRQSAIQVQDAKIRPKYLDLAEPESNDWKSFWELSRRRLPVQCGDAAAKIGFAVQLYEKKNPPTKPRNPR